MQISYIEDSSSYNPLVKFVRRFFEEDFLVDKKEIKLWIDSEKIQIFEEDVPEVFENNC